MASLWLVDPKKVAFPRVANPTKAELKLGSKPLVDLSGLQQAIKTGALGDDDVWPATRRAENNLEDLKWIFGDLLDCIACLSSADFKGAEWCEDRNGNWHPCDAYAIRYDHLAKCRVRYSDINYYLKFSLEEDGALTLVLISCHL